MTGNELCRKFFQFFCNTDDLCDLLIAVSCLLLKMEPTDHKIRQGPKLLPLRIQDAQDSVMGAARQENVFSLFMNYQELFV